MKFTSVFFIVFVISCSQNQTDESSSSPKEKDRHIETNKSIIDFDTTCFVDFSQSRQSLDNLYLKLEELKLQFQTDSLNKALRFKIGKIEAELMIMEDVIVNINQRDSMISKIINK